MKFVLAGEGVTGADYWLWDYSDDPKGKLIMCISILHHSERWYFVSQNRNLMNMDHMKALYEFLGEVLIKS
ncbi:hypothetical protein WKH56_20470 [Priestia sp. SB1]|uniref:hypothetical protein n=1 Tax=Priestia sp. SB1 TaxID=3132359 RepID=UPI003170B953